MDTTSKEIYPIVEIFHSIQGEGFWVGTNALFIRLAGCDVQCSWCDQKETWPIKGSSIFYLSCEELTQKVLSFTQSIVVVTGGEPLMHNLYPLTNALKKAGLKVHLETSGAHSFSGDFDWVTFSPKTFKAPNPSIYTKADELKVIVANEQDLKWGEEIARNIPSNTFRYLQSEWNSPASIQVIVEYVLRHPQWRLSLQSHKFLNIP